MVVAAVPDQPPGAVSSIFLGGISNPGMSLLQRQIGVADEPKGCRCEHLAVRSIFVSSNRRNVFRRGRDPELLVAGGLEIAVSPCV